jgi:hypothetical protein
MAAAASTAAAAAAGVATRDDRVVIPTNHGKAGHKTADVLTGALAARDIPGSVEAADERIEPRVAVSAHELVDGHR